MNFLNNPKNSKKLYTLDILFDYLQVNLEPSILVSNLSHAWSEASEAIRRAETLDEKDSIKVAKVISFLIYLEKIYHYLHQKRFYKIPLNLKKSEKLIEILKNLEDKKVVVYRNFKNALCTLFWFRYKFR